MEQNNQPNYNIEDEQSIDWIGWIKKVWSHRKSFYISMPIAFVVAAIYLLAIPNFYTVTVKLAPELSSGSSSGGGLSSLMRSFGVGGGSMSSGHDAIMPDLYPELMNSKAFQVSLFDIQVRNKKGDINTTYYDYLLNHQKSPWYSKAISAVFKGIGKVISLLRPASDEEEGDANAPANAFQLTKDQDRITKAITKKVVCSVDKKTFLITINVTDQDPVICANMADSVCARLQEFITEYRTKKSRQELADVQAQYDKAYAEYEEARNTVANTTSSNWNLVNESMMLQQQTFQNEMQIKLSTVSAFATQLVAARTKLEASRPVYTVLNGASVPLIKAGPKRASSVIIFCFFIALLQSAWILRDELKEQFFGGNNSQG